jgi:hypothetical protein
MVESGKHRTCIENGDFYTECLTRAKDPWFFMHVIPGAARHAFS